MKIGLDPASATPSAPYARRLAELLAKIRAAAPVRDRRAPLRRRGPLPRQQPALPLATHLHGILRVVTVADLDFLRHPHRYSAPRTPRPAPPVPLLVPQGALHHRSTAQPGRTRTAPRHRHAQDPRGAPRWPPARPTRPAAPTRSASTCGGSSACPAVSCWPTGCARPTSTPGPDRRPDRDGCRPRRILRPPHPLCRLPARLRPRRGSGPRTVFIYESTPESGGRCSAWPTRWSARPTHAEGLDPPRRGGHARAGTPLI